MAKRRFGRARRYYAKLRARSKKMTIPVAPLIGIAGGLYPAIDAAMRGQFQDVIPWSCSMLTGYHLRDKKWYFSDVVKGWTPILAGFAAHKAASMIGINRLLAAAKVPLVRV